MFKQIYNKISSRPFWFLFLIQLILILIVYHKIVFSPNQYMFANIYDGLKNYFTFTQFIAQDNSPQGPFHFTQMNYPFGEYIFFTDNTPILSLPLRWINQNVVNIESNLIRIHNLIFLLSLLFTPLLFFKLIKPYIKDYLLMALILAISFSWINPQLLKLLYGIYNLSLSVVLLACLLLLQSIYDYYMNSQNGSLIKINVGLYFLIFLSAFAHLYYIPIIALPVGVFVGLTFLFAWIKTKEIRLIPLFSILFTTAFAGLSVYFIIQLIDSYSMLRQSTASGFNWITWRFTPEAIFTPYRYNTLFPVVKSCKYYGDIPSESHGFWGNFIWFLIYIVFFYILYKLFRKELSFNSLKSKIKENLFFLALLAVMFTSYATASGSYIELCVVPLAFDNIFSLFYFLEDKIDMITQFRCLGRFSWMGFWIVSFLASVTFIKLYGSLYLRNKNMAIGMGLILTIILSIDTIQAMLYQSKVFEVNVFKEQVLIERFAKVDEVIDFEEYQATLSIPAVQVGSENYDYTIDDQLTWTEYWMQLGVYTKLPTFNCKMSRTAVEQAKAQLDLLKYAEIPDLIKNKLNEKPVLVIYSPQHQESFDLRTNDYALEAFENGSQIIKAFEMDTILVDKNVYYLHWDVKNYH